MSPGVKNADENELKAIASPPQESHVYNVADFSVMSDIVEGLTKTVCDRVEQLDKQIKGLNGGLFTSEILQTASTVITLSTPLVIIMTTGDPQAIKTQSQSNIMQQSHLSHDMPPPS